MKHFHKISFLISFVFVLYLIGHRFLFEINSFFNVPILLIYIFWSFVKMGIILASHHNQSEIPAQETLGEKTLEQETAEQETLGQQASDT